MSVSDTFSSLSTAIASFGGCASAPHAPSVSAACLRVSGADARHNNLSGWTLFFDDSLLLRLALNIDLYFARTINAISFGLLYCTEVLQLQICAQYIILACVFIILRTCKSFFFPFELEFALLRQPRGYLVVRLTSHWLGIGATIYT